MHKGGTPAALVFYHYLHPDDVVSAVLFTQLCTGLAERGWRVVGCSSNRGWEDERPIYPRRSVWKGAEFRRIWRPGLRQASGFGRLANAAWMCVAWSLLALNPRVRPQVMVVGTDPILSPIVAVVWKFLRPRVRLVHWCFDLYPEAAVADGVLRDGTLLVRFLKIMLR